MTDKERIELATRKGWTRCHVDPWGFPVGNPPGQISDKPMLLSDCCLFNQHTEHGAERRRSREATP